MVNCCSAPQLQVKAGCCVPDCLPSLTLPASAVQAVIKQQAQEAQREKARRRAEKEMNARTQVSLSRGFTCP